jgi:hypothetical protein
MSDRDVADTLSRLATDQDALAGWWPQTPGEGFVARYGHVEYRRVMAREQLAIRAQILAGGTCEVDHRHSRDGLVFDHCHDHAWVRAVVCHSCNVKLGQLDATRKLPGITVVPADTGFGRIIMKCPGGVENVAAWIPASGPFAPKPKGFAVKPRSWENVLSLEFVVRPRAPSMVHARWGNRTACGLMADRALAATTQQRYCASCSVIVPRRHWEAAVRDDHARGLVTVGVVASE